jgi:tetratricopeptide (TPR) repeat protein
LNLPLEARQALQRALELDPKNPYIAYALAGVELQSRMPDQARVHFEQYVRSMPNDPRGHFGLGAAEFEMSNYADAAKEMKIAARAAHPIPDAECYLGRIDRINGEPERAIEHFDRALTLQPACAECFAERGRLLTESKRFAEAREDLTRALAIAPDDLSANQFLLALYQKTRDPRVAEQAKKVDVLRMHEQQKQQDMLRSLDIRPVSEAAGAPE